MSSAQPGMMVNANVRLVEPLGQGGMGSVWIAEHLALHTRVVVKFIASSLKDDADAHSRFSREAAAAAQVKSPHVVQTFDHGLTDEGLPYIVMELLEGRDLGALIRAHGRVPLPMMVEILTQLGRGLDRAHERGIVHRDIKPENVFICDEERGALFVKVLDFGIAKGVTAGQLDGSTKTGSMMGSPYYMSPEQILSSRNVDFHSDLWSIGVMTFEAITGAKPFDAETVGGLAIKIHTEPLPLPTQVAPDLPPPVDTWFMKACARKPEDRFPSASAMAAAFAEAVQEAPTSSDAFRPTLPAGPDSLPVSRPPVQSPAVSGTHLTMSRTDAPRRSRSALFVGVGVVGLVSGLFFLRSSPDAPSTPSGSASPTMPAAPPAPTASTTVEPASVASLAPLPPASAPAAASASAPPGTSPAPAKGTPVALPERPGRPRPAPLPALAPAASVPKPAAPKSSAHDIF